MTFLTASLVIITAYYAFNTHRTLKVYKEMLNEMKIERELAYRPVLTFSYSGRSSNSFEFRVKNSGRGPAINIHVDFPDSPSINWFNPANRAIDPFAEINMGFNLDPPHVGQIKITIRWEDLLGNEYFEPLNVRSMK